MSTHDESRRWPTQDQENGNYMIHCLSCDAVTIGPKRAQTCYPCHQKGQARWNALSDEEKARELACLAQRLEAERNPATGTGTQGKGA